MNQIPPAQSFVVQELRDKAHTTVPDRSIGAILIKLGRLSVADAERVMRFQIERAHSYYDSADKGIPMLEPDSRLTVTLMSHNYRRILSAIEDMDYDVFSRRASIPLHRKLLSVPALWYSVR